MPVASGRIGTVETGRGRFAAELLGGEVRLEAGVVEATSPGCRATLGDRRCRVAMRGRRTVVRVTSQDGARLVLTAGAGFARGRLRWIGGANGGLSTFIVAADAQGVTLEAPPAFDGAGALVELSEGCDGTLATCRDRFGNVANFRGEPHLPGIDLLTRYPGGGRAGAGVPAGRTGGSGRCAAGDERAGATAPGARDGVGRDPRRCDGAGRGRTAGAAAMAGRRHLAQTGG